MIQNKSEIRTAIRAKRQALSLDYQQQAAKQCCENIINSKVISEQHTNIACYLSNDCELGLENLFDYCWSHNKNSYLPVLNNNKLDFIKYTNNSILKPNIYNIPEPIASNPSVTIPPQELDLVFLPLVAFTIHGERLGMGGGYYDRTFAFLHETFNNYNNKPILIGVAYDLQCVEALPCDSWDINLNGIVTETQYIKF